MTSRDRAVPESPIPFNEFLAPGLRGYFQYPSRIERSIQEVIRDSATWADFWLRLTTHPSQTAPSTPAPEIDFTHEMVIAVGFGSQRDGRTTEIDSVALRDGELLVRYRRGWNPSESVTDSFNWPIAIARIPRDDEHRVTFQDVSAKQT